MAAVDDEFSFLASSVERAVTVQELTAEQLLDVSLRRGQVLATRLVRHYRSLSAQVRERREAFGEFDDPVLKGSAITEMRTILAYVRTDLQRCLAWLDAASESVLDVGTRYLIEYLASTLVSPESEVTVVADADGSYSMSVSDLLDKSFDEGGEEEGIAIVISIPRREQHSGLLHTLIVHELGHAASRQHHLALKLIKAAIGEKLFSAEHDAATHGLASALEVNASARGFVCDRLEIELLDKDDADGLSEAASAYLWRTAKSCVEEAICDAFAIRLLGPTYLYAFAAIVGTSDLDSSDELHPTARLRIKLMLDQLDALKWDGLLHDETPLIDGWFRERAAEKGPPMETVPTFSAVTVVGLAGEIREVVDRHVDTLSFSPADFPEEVKGAIRELLEVGIPPAQIQRLDDGVLATIGRPQIMLGSWLFAIEQGGGELEAIAQAPSLPELSTLLPKALELSALEEAWVKPS